MTRSHHDLCAASHFSFLSFFFLSKQSVRVLRRAIPLALDGVALPSRIFFLSFFLFLLSLFPSSPRHADFADTWYIHSYELILIERNNDRAHAHGDRATHTEARTHAEGFRREHEHSRGVEIESQGLATPELHAALGQDWLVKGRKFAYYK